MSKPASPGSADRCCGPASTGPFSVFEALAVGARRLLGEVIQLRGDELVAQVYEDTTGLEPGMPVDGPGAPLSVTLGPGLLGGIFDGLLRPLTGTRRFPDPARALAARVAAPVRVESAVEAGAHAERGRRSSR